MKRVLGALLSTVLLSGLGSPARADDKEATAILDKAIKALGGEEKLAKVKAATWKAKCELPLLQNDFAVQVTMQGFDKHRQDLDGQNKDKKIHRVTILAGDEGWATIDDKTVELDRPGLANLKRGVYLEVVSMMVLPLKGKDFKVEAGGEEKVGGKLAAVVKATGPDGKDFTLFFDKESGLPVKLVAKMEGLFGEMTQETTFGNYKEVDGGINKAMKIVTDQRGLVTKLEITEFKVLDKVDPKTFAKPK